MTPTEYWLSKMKPPSKKLKEFCKQHNISWNELDEILVKHCDHHELDTLNQGNFSDRQKIINKYLL